MREKKKISQKEISFILEVSQTIYGKWESDRFFPTYQNLKKIAAFYELDIESLVQTETSNENSFKKRKSNKRYLKMILKNIKELKSLLYVHIDNKKFKE